VIGEAVKPPRALGARGAAVLIALVYAIAGPPIGAVLVVPSAVLAASAFMHGTLLDSFAVVVSAFPTMIPLSYAFAGTLALVTGIALGAVAFRRQRLPLPSAVVVPVVVVMAFALLRQIIHVDVPGTAILRGNQSGLLIWLVVSILSSLACWLLTVPIHRRMR